MDYLENDVPRRYEAGGFNGGWTRLEERPTKELLKEFVGEARALMQEELRLAKAELKAETKNIPRAGAAFGMGGAFLHVALFAIAACLVAVFYAVLFFQLWAAALIVAGVFAFFGLMALLYGKSRLKKLRADNAMRNLKEDREWARDTMQTIRSRRHASA
jgi:uncharacterized membrane protein YqjE